MCERERARERESERGRGRHSARTCARTHVYPKSHVKTATVCVGESERAREQERERERERGREADETRAKCLDLIQTPPQQRPPDHISYRYEAHPHLEFMVTKFETRMSRCFAPSRAGSFEANMVTWCARTWFPSLSSASPLLQSSPICMILA